MGAAGGIGMMLLGVFLFAVNDSLGKWLVGTYAVGQLMVMRSLSGLLAMSYFIHRTGPRAFLGVSRPGLQFMRVIFATLEGSLFYWALTELPLAEVMAYYMAGPIYVTALSPFLLGERVGVQRWIAVIIGFGGVLLALHPTSGSFSFGTCCALAGSFSYALFLVATRKLAGTPGTVLMTFQLLAALIFGSAFILAHGWKPPSALDLVLLLLLGIGSLGGNLCVNQSLRFAPASVVVPYQYTLIVWALVFGWLVFGDWPSSAMLFGSALIIAAGLALLMLERRAGNAASDTAKERVTIEQN